MQTAKWRSRGGRCHDGACRRADGSSVAFAAGNKHQAEASSMPRKRSRIGKQGHADALVKHAEATLKHAEGAMAETKNPHVTVKPSRG